jgi:protein-disulfide isomerase
MEKKMSEKHTGKKYAKQQQKKNDTWIFIGIAAVVVVVVVIMIVSNLPKPVGTISLPTPNPRPQANGSSMGDPNAPVKIVEYSDYQCPFCGKFATDTESQIVDTYVKTGKVYFTYRSMGNYISDSGNRANGGNDTESILSAQAAYCAGDQGQFWQYHDALFANQNGENAGTFSRAFMDAMAKQMGLDTTTFASCLDTQKYAAQAAQDEVDGKNAATTAPNYDGKGYGTPFFIINGNVLMGAQPFSVFQAQIDAALAAAGK